MLVDKVLVRMNHEGASVRGRVAAIAIALAGILIVMTLAHETASARASTILQQAAPKVRVGGTPVVPAGAKPLAAIAPSRRMRITVALQPRSPAALSDYAEGVSDPASPDYRHYLTTAQFRRRFAPTAATVRRVRRALRASGLRPGALTANGLAIQLTASAAAIERAFAVTLARVRLADGAEVLYNTRAPALAADVAHDVQAVVGLDGFAHETPLLVRPERSASPLLSPAAFSSGADEHELTGGPQPCPAAEDAPTDDPDAAGGGYTADQLATAYSFSGLYRRGDLGQGVTVALYELEPNLTTDIAAYQKCYGTHTSVSYVKVDGGDTAKTDPDYGGPAGSGEAALDIEQLIGLAPEAKILVYQGPNSDGDFPGSGPYDTLAAIVDQDRAAVVSISWGDCEAVLGASAAQAEYDLYAEAAIQGQTVVAAAGDSGSEDCYEDGYDSLGVDDPGSQPFVTSAGGTTLESAEPTRVEQVWNDGDPGPNDSGGGAGGGGLSDIWRMPAYQSDAPSGLNVIQSDSLQEGCGPSVAVPDYPYCREVPDVSATADEYHGVLIYYDGTQVTSSPAYGWQAIGGTSTAAPLWGALFALADADSACHAQIGFANGRLYQLAGESQDTYFNDITEGNNDMTGAYGGLFPAGTGYDMASGLGTPIASALAPALCERSVIITAPRAQRTFKGQAVSLKLHASRGAGVTGALSYGASHLPAGLELDATTGAISGSPTQIGVHTVTIDAHTAAGIYGAARFKWTVAGHPRVSRLSLSQVGGGLPSLAFSIAAGRDETGLRRLQLRLPRGLSASVDLAAVRVLGATGRPLARRISRRGARVVTIRLKQSRAKLRVLFTGGSLDANGAIRGDALRRDPAPLPLVLEVTDAAAGTSTLRLAVRPQS